MKYSEQECEVASPSFYIVNVPNFKSHRICQVRWQVASSRVNRCLSWFNRPNTSSLQGLSYLTSHRPIATTYVGDFNARRKFVPYYLHCLGYLSAYCNRRRPVTNGVVYIAAK